MPGKHKEPTIAFRPSAWERAIIEQRAALSGMKKKDFIVRSCIYSNIVVVGKKENVQRIVDVLQEMKIVMEELARQIQSGEFSLSNSGYDDLKRDYLALVISVVDIVNGAAYLFGNETGRCWKDKKAEQKLEQLRYALENSGDSS